MASTPTKKPEKPIRNKSYLLHFHKEKNAFGKVKLNIQLKSFNVDENWYLRKNIFIEKAKARGDSCSEITLTKEQQRKITSWLKITEADVHLLLTVIYDSLASNLWFDDIKNTILQTKDRIKYNPIMVIMLENGSRVEDILEIIDFDFKRDIMEILTSHQITSRDKYKKIEKIQHFQKVQNSISWTFKKQAWKIAFYLVVLGWIVVWVKFKLFPLLEEKLVRWMWLDRDIMLGTSEKMINSFSMFIVALISVWMMALLLFIINRQAFFALMYKTPKLWEIIQYGNTLRLLMTFSFNYDKNVEFRKKIFETTNMYFKLPEDTSLQNAWEVIAYNDESLHKKWWIDFYDPLVSVGLDQLKTWWPTVVEEVTDKKIEAYIEKMKKAQDSFSTAITSATVLLVALMVFMVMSAIMIISFSALGAVKTE